MIRFLFATDFEKGAVGAFKFTALLAHHLDATITMYNAFGTGLIVDKATTSRRGSKAIDQLKSFVEEHLHDDLSDISFNYIAEESFALDGVLSVSSDEYIDVVVMAMKHDTNFFQKLIGNTTLDTLAPIECGLLIVPEGFRTKKIDRLGCTTDFKFKDIAMINLLREMGKKLGKDTTIHCLHVLEGNEDEQRAHKDIEVLYSIYNGRKGTPVKLSMESGSLPETVENFAVENEIDLLVMTSEQRKPVQQMLNRSRTREVARNIQVPLLILKDL